MRRWCRAEMRKAFFAGAVSMFGVVTGDITLVSDKAGMARLSEYQREIHEYVAELEAATRI